MRWLLVPACALLLLSGCGQSSTDSPKLAIKPGKDGTLPDPKKDPSAVDPKKDSATAAKQGGAADTKNDKGTGEVKKDSTAPAEVGAFARDDARKTLDWLIKSLPKTGDLPSDEEATRTLWKSAYKQTIQWTLPVDSTVAEGIVVVPLQSPDYPLCEGMRLKPFKQLGDGSESFTLEIPAAGRAALRSGDRVTIAGVVELIETRPRRSRAVDRPYRFNIRLSGYTVTPTK